MSSAGELGHMSVCQPGRVWSLWQLLNFDGSGWYQISWFIQAMDETISQLRPPTAVHVRMFGGIPFEPFEASLRDMGLMGPLACLERIKSLSVTQSDGDVVIPEASVDQYGIELFDLSRRLRDELHYKMFLSLSPTEKDFFSPTEPLFGKEVDLKFTDAAFEIGEAGKCIALGRYTATGFHLMRATEVGLRAIARCLNIADPTKPVKRNWHFILEKSIKPKMDAMTQSRGWKSDSDKQFFREVYTSADAVRSAWRNPTMHVEHRYDQDEAHHVYATVKGLMQKLASRMDQDGLPLA